MNTERKRTRVAECTQCGDAYMVCGDTAIGLAFPRTVSRVWNSLAGEIQRAKGVCPKHRRKANAD